MENKEIIKLEMVKDIAFELYKAKMFIKHGEAILAAKQDYLNEVIENSDVIINCCGDAEVIYRGNKSFVDYANEQGLNLGQVSIKDFVKTKYLDRDLMLEILPEELVAAYTADVERRSKLFKKGERVVVDGGVEIDKAVVTILEEGTVFEDQNLDYPGEIIVELDMFLGYPNVRLLVDPKICTRKEA